MTRAQFLAALLAVGVALWVIDLVRRRKLSEEYSLLSLVAMAGVLVLAFWTKGLTWITHQFGALYETSIIFFFGLVFAFVTLLYYATKLTSLTQEVRRLAQESAILKLKLERLGGDPAGGGAGGAGGAGGRTRGPSETGRVGPGTGREDP